MNHNVKVEAVITELKDNIASDGPPPTGDFPALCEYVTKWMVRRYKLASPDDINWGYCFIWAYLVWALWPNENEVTFKTVTGHVVVKFGNLYYDSEHTEGNENLKKFCSFEYSGEDGAKHVNINWMCWYWARAGKKLREFRRLIRKTHPKLYKSVRDNGKGHWNAPFENFYGFVYIDKLSEVA